MQCQRVSWSVNFTNGLIYVRHRRHRTIDPDAIIGIGGSSGPGVLKGAMTRPSGTLERAASAAVVGNAFSVDAFHRELQLEYGDGDTLYSSGSSTALSARSFGFTANCAMFTGAASCCTRGAMLICDICCATPPLLLIGCCAYGDGLCDTGPPADAAPSAGVSNSAGIIEP